MVERRLWWVRCVGDTRLRLARALAEIEVEEHALVILRDERDVRGVARVVGECQSQPADDNPVLSIEGRLMIDPGSATRLSTFLDQDAAFTVDSEHRWGAIGAPAGPETTVSTSGAASDVGLAFASAGYREVRSDRLHQLVPGDVCSLDGEQVIVTAIDRRNNVVELVHDLDGKTTSIALDEFIRKETSE